MTVRRVNNKIANFLKVLYILATIFVAYSLAEGNIHIEFCVKLVALFALSFLYLETTPKVNYWYVLILLFSIVSDSLFIFKDFYYPALSFLILNRFLYLVIIRKSIMSYLTGKVFYYAVPFLLTFFMIYFLLYDYLKDVKAAAFILGVASVLLLIFTFLDFLNKNTNRVKYFFFGTTLMPFADVLMAISEYIDMHITYVIIYHFMYYTARFLIYKSMITYTNDT